MTNSKIKNYEESTDGSVTINTPAEIQLFADAEKEIQDCSPNCADKCHLSAHQLIFVGGQVSTTITPHCITKVKCLNSGFGDPCPSGKPAPCTFKFYQNLCVEVDVSINADAKCTIDQIKCMGVSPGPCSSK
jgi:hypothetical protein